MFFFYKSSLIRLVLFLKIFIDIFWEHIQMNFLIEHKRIGWTFPLGAWSFRQLAHVSTDISQFQLGQKSLFGC